MSLRRAMMASGGGAPPVLLTPWDDEYLSSRAYLDEDGYRLRANSTTPYANSRSLVPLVGARYFSVDCVKNGSNNWGIGLADEAVVLSSGGNYVGFGNSIGIWYEGRVYQGGAVTHTVGGITGGVEMAFREDLRAVWIRNESDPEYIGGGDPELGTSPTGILGGSGAIYIAGTIDSTGAATGYIRLPMTPGDVTGSGPSGFSIGVV